MERFTDRPLNLREAVLLDTIQKGLDAGIMEIAKFLEFLELRATNGYDPGTLEVADLPSALQECIAGVHLGAANRGA